MINIADNLKRIREDNNLSQSELGRLTGIKQQNISRWELGLHYPSIIECIKLADYFKITLDELVNRDFI